MSMYVVGNNTCTKLVKILSVKRRLNIVLSQKYVHVPIAEYHTY